MKSEVVLVRIFPRNGSTENPNEPKTEGQLDIPNRDKPSVFTRLKRGFKSLTLRGRQINNVEETANTSLRKMEASQQGSDPKERSVTRGPGESENQSIGPQTLLDQSNTELSPPPQGLPPKVQNRPASELRKNLPPPLHQAHDRPEWGLSAQEIQKIDQFVKHEIQSVIAEHGQSLKAADGYYIKKERFNLPRTIQVDQSGKIIVHLKKKKVKTLGEGHIKFATLSVDWDAGQIRANTVMHMQGDALMSADVRADCAKREQAVAKAIRLAHPSKTTHLVRPVAIGHYTVKGKEKRNVVVELCTGGEMVEKSMPGQKGSLERWKLVYQAMQGLQQLHDLGFVHRDVKPENIFLTHDEEGELVVKVADFDLSDRSSPEGLCEDQEVVGTPTTYAPEMWRRQQELGEAVIGKASDTFGVALVALHAVLGHHLENGATWENLNPIVGYKLGVATSGDAGFENKQLWQGLGLGMLVNEKGPDREVREIVVEMLNPDPEKRIALPDAIERMGQAIAKWEAT